MLVGSSVYGVGRGGRGRGEALRTIVAALLVVLGLFKVGIVLRP